MGQGVLCTVICDFSAAGAVAWLVNFDRKCRHRKSRFTARSVNAKDLSVKLRDRH
jgi:hypothetical protein